MKDKLVTIFGGGGFLGRYIAQELLSRGARVRVAERNPGDAVRIRPLGGLGQTQLVSADITQPASVARAVEGAHAVVNLVGVLKGDFQALHVDGAGNVARAAAEAGAKALVHVSALGADADSPSAYGRSKAQGEVSVRAAFPDAVIVRPSIVFGREDQFTNRFAGLIRSMPVVPVIGAATRFQPIYVGDLARAIAVIIEEQAASAGQTYELGGPQVLSMLELNQWLAAAIGRDRAMVTVPAPAASLLAAVTGWLPGAPITRDQWAMLQKDNVVSPGAATLADLGIAPTPLAAVAESWLVSYRRHGRFAGRASV